MKKKIILVCLIILIIFVFFLILPLVEFKKDGKLYFIKYKEDFSYFESYTCYGESVSYDEKRDISITNIDIKKKFFFYVYNLEYEDGNLCDSEYILEESYIDNFINNAEIIDNYLNIDIKSLIEGKTAIVGNTRYTGNDYTQGIYYNLDGKYQELYVFYVDDLLVIQVGSFDDGARFISYK